MAWVVFFVALFVFLLSFFVVLPVIMTIIDAFQGTGGLSAEGTAVTNVYRTVVLIVGVVVVSGLFLYALVSSRKRYYVDSP